MPLVAGVDSSAQSTKVLLCRADDGRVLGQGRAPHPPGTECDPRYWWSALLRAGDGLLDRAAALAVGEQQHGLVVLDGYDRVIRPALLCTPENLARAAVEGVLGSVADAADLLARCGVGSAWALAGTPDHRTGPGRAPGDIPVSRSQKCGRAMPHFETPQRAGVTFR